MRILRYGKRVKIGPGFGFDIVPEQEIDDGHAMFDAILEAVKKSGLDYVLIERTERMIEHGGDEEDHTSQ